MSVPMLTSKAMPVDHFHNLFMNWADNDALDLKSLCLKAIKLLALNTFAAKHLKKPIPQCQACFKDY